MDVIPSRSRPRIPRTGLALALGLSFVGPAPGGLAAQIVWRLGAALVEIGTVDGADPYLFEDVAYARLLPDGRIVVADAGAPAVRVYAADGTFETRLGGQGAGPGEYEMIAGVWLTSVGAVAVFDPANMRITTFSPDGELIETSRVQPASKGPGGTPQALVGSYPNGDIALLALEFGPGSTGPTPDRWTALRYSPDGTPRSESVVMRGLRRLGGQVLPFSALGHLAILGGTAYVGDGTDARITVHGEEGALVREIALPEAPVDPEAAWSGLVDRVRRQEVRNHAMYESLIDEIPHDEVPQIGALLPDERGFIWVKHYDPSFDSVWERGDLLRVSPGGEWRIVQPDGAWIATVRIPAGVTPLTVEGDRIVCVARDDLDVQRVVVYELER